jgi:cytochrome bd-type quinol oxidase subunit 1
MCSACACTWCARTFELFFSRSSAMWACAVVASALLVLQAAGQAQAPATVAIRRDESGALQLVDGNVTVAIKDAVVRAELSAAVSAQRSELAFLTATLSALRLNLTAALSAQRLELSSLRSTLGAEAATTTGAVDIGKPRPKPDAGKTGRPSCALSWKRLV